MLGAFGEAFGDDLGVEALDILKEVRRRIYTLLAEAD